MRNQREAFIYKTILLVDNDVTAKTRMAFFLNILISNLQIEDPRIEIKYKQLKLR